MVRVEGNNSTGGRYAPEKAGTGSCIGARVAEKTQVGVL